MGGCGCGWSVGGGHVEVWVDMLCWDMVSQQVILLMGRVPTTEKESESEHTTQTPDTQPHSSVGLPLRRPLKRGIRASLDRLQITTDGFD